MKKHVTRLMSVMLAAVMLMALLPTSAFAVKVHAGENGQFRSEKWHDGYIAFRNSNPDTYKPLPTALPAL